MAKRTLVLLALALLLAGCSDDGRESVKAQRDRQYSQLATADARTAPPPAATITTQPFVIATMTPTPQPATATPGRTLNVFVTPVAAVEVQAGESATK